MCLPNAIFQMQTIQLTVLWRRINPGHTKPRVIREAVEGQKQLKVKRNDEQIDRPPLPPFSVYGQKIQTLRLGFKKISLLNFFLKKKKKVYITDIQSGLSVASDDNKSPVLPGCY